MSIGIQRWFLVPVIVAVMLLLVGSASFTEAQSQEATDQKATSQKAASGDKLKVEDATSAQATGTPGSLSALQKKAIENGPLVPDPAAEKRAKAEAAQKAQQLSPEAAASSSPGGVEVKPSSSGAPEKLAPTYTANFEGAFQTNTGPSDSTGAVGTSRYIETVNSRFQIFTKTGASVSSGTLQQLAGVASTDRAFDPQVMWDGKTNRFYYVMDNVASSTTNRLAFGFSRTASPNNGTTDFCHYVINFGSRFPDYPKLGDSANRLLIGANAFSGTSGGFLGSDLYSVTKPAAGTTCPAASTFTVGTLFNLTSSTSGFTPVPANQTDDSTTGFAVARNISLPSSTMKIYNVVENATTKTFNLSTRNLTVASYGVPADATQPGTTRKLDTLDARPTQAVSAFDPFRGTAIWVQHTIFGGAGAKVRWYEINPFTSTPSLFQQREVFGTSGLHVFNAAISPNRQVVGATKRFGDSMVMGFNTSSTAQRPDIRTVSKIRNNTETFGPIVRSSSFSLNDFTCSSGVCRWGDYSAATPDPLPASTDPNGKVWLTNQYVRSTGSTSSSGWGTRNWASRP